MPDSAKLLKRLGVVFGREDNGTPFFEARNELMHGRVMREIERRCGLIQTQLESGKRLSEVRIVDRPQTKRWGECMICGDPMEDHVGGDCELCVGGVRMARRKMEGT